MHLFFSYSYFCSIKEREKWKRKGIQLLNPAYSASVKENKETQWQSLRSKISLDVQVNEQQKSLSKPNSILERTGKLLPVVYLKFTQLDKVMTWDLVTDLSGHIPYFVGFYPFAHGEMHLSSPFSGVPPLTDGRYLGSGLCFSAQNLRCALHLLLTASLVMLGSLYR